MGVMHAIAQNATAMNIVGEKRVFAFMNLIGLSMPRGRYCRCRFSRTGFRYLTFTVSSGRVARGFEKNGCNRFARLKSGNESGQPADAFTFVVIVCFGSHCRSFWRHAD